MGKTPVEMAAEVATAQTGQTSMTSDEIADALNKTYETLKNVKAKEEEPGEEPRAARVIFNCLAGSLRDRANSLSAQKQRRPHALTFRGGWPLDKKSDDSIS